MTDRILRYTLVERVVHWLAALTYMYVLATGLAFYAPGLYWIATVLGGGPTSRFWHPWMALVFLGDARVDAARLAAGHAHHGGGSPVGRADGALHSQRRRGPAAHRPLQPGTEIFLLGDALCGRRAADLRGRALASGARAAGRCAAPRFCCMSRRRWSPSAHSSFTSTWARRWFAAASPRSFAAKSPRRGRRRITASGIIASPANEPGNGGSRRADELAEESPVLPELLHFYHEIAQLPIDCCRRADAGESGIAARSHPPHRAGPDGASRAHRHLTWDELLRSADPMHAFFARVLLQANAESRARKTRDPQRSAAGLPFLRREAGRRGPPSRRAMAASASCCARSASPSGNSAACFAPTAARKTRRNFPSTPPPRCRTSASKPATPAASISKRST